MGVALKETPQTVRVSGGDLCRRQKHRPSRQARPQCAVLPDDIDKAPFSAMEQKKDLFVGNRFCGSA